MDPEPIRNFVIVLAASASVISLARIAARRLARLLPGLTAARWLSESRALGVAALAVSGISLTLLVALYVRRHGFEMAWAAGIVAAAWVVCWLLDLARNPPR